VGHGVGAPTATFRADSQSESEGDENDDGEEISAEEASSTVECCDVCFIQAQDTPIALVPSGLGMRISFNLLNV